MSGEEKILSFLEKIQGSIDTMQRTMEERLGCVEAEQASQRKKLEELAETQAKHGDEIAELKSSLARVKSSLARVAIVVENTLDMRVSALLEGQVTINQQMSQFREGAEYVRDLRDIVPVLKDAVQTHTHELGEGRKLFEDHTRSLAEHSRTLADHARTLHVHSRELAELKGA